MNKKDYMRDLSYRLRRLPKEDYNKAMDYFEEYFEEAGEENEAQAIKDLGTPEDAARELILSLAAEKSKSGKKGMRHLTSALWIGVLAVLAAPIALPLALVVLLFAAGLLIAIAALYLSGLVLCVSVLACGVLGVIGGVCVLFQSLPDGIATLGFSLLFTGLGLLCTFLMLKLSQLILLGTIKLLGKFSKKGGQRHEKKKLH